MLNLKTLMFLNQPFISAASGLVKLDQLLYVIGDDENFLGIYDLKTQRGVSSIIFPQDLPENKDERKKLKKDFESMLYLPLTQEILLIPSGSTETRVQGALVDLKGELKREVSFAFLYQFLMKQIPELNIEGAALLDNSVYFFQRGNGPSGISALISLPWEDFLHERIQNLKVIPVELGELNKVKLSFTDATNFGNHFLYLAVAEDSASVYLDGEVSGAMIGIISSAGTILAQERLNLKSKPEGLNFSVADFSFYVVTDDDDRSHPASLLLGQLPLEWKSFLL